jgi:two-component system, chemotaxis family, protein-glutamate methylesterase/glutaminase
VSAVPSGAKVRVVVVDDSPTARHLLVAICERDPDITVVGEASDGTQAVALVGRLRPDLVLMDVNMPHLDGLEATKTIMRETPTPIIMVTAGTSSKDVEAGLNAIRFGALSVVPKPLGPEAPGFGGAAERLTSMVKALAEVRVVRRRIGGPLPNRAPSYESTPRILAIAASTGGPPALCRFLQHLPPDLPVPVVVVQHLVAGFLPGLVDWMRAEVPFHVVQAETGQTLRPGTVYLAPDGTHLEVTASLRAKLTNSPPVAGFRPSASVLFDSVARSVGKEGIAVVLTGMGQDGYEGARTLHAAGGRVFAQDEESSAVYGMPRVVIEAGIADHVGALEELAGQVAVRVRG